MTSPRSSGQAAWLVIVLLSIVQAGAAIGNEDAHYFWDLTSYVEALDSPYPYRAQRTYPFLYPPLAADLMRLARSHLFELATIAYVGALIYFLAVFARLNVARRFEWLLAVTAMGGLGTISLQSGNLAILMNFPVLGLAYQSAMGQPLAHRLLPVAIGVGALLKPQFIVFLWLLPFVESTWRAALVKIAAAGAAVAAVYGAYMLWRPFEWNEYVTAVMNRAITERDYAWGPSAFAMNFTQSEVVAGVAYVAALVLVSLLAYSTWRRTVQAGQPMPAVATVSLAFIVLTFTNPRLPLYDIYTAAIALAVCCALANTTIMPWVLAASMTINVMPWLITEFARIPAAWPGWMQNVHFAHVAGVGALLIALSRAGMRAREAQDEPSRR